MKLYNEGNLVGNLPFWSRVRGLRFDKVELSYGDFLELEQSLNAGKAEPQDAVRYMRNIRHGFTVKAMEAWREEGRKI